MDNAAHNMHEELADVNNLWRYPDGFDTYPLAGPSTKLIPQFWKIGSFQDSGNNSKAAGARPSSWKCEYTDQSITSKGRESGYMAAIMLGLDSGVYTMSFDADVAGQMKFVQYGILPDGSCVNNEAASPGKVQSFSAGHNSFDVIVPDGTYLMMLFCEGLISKNTDTPVTLTDVIIKEGVL